MEDNSICMLSVRHAAICDNNMMCPKLVYQRDADGSLPTGTLQGNLEVLVERDLAEGKMEISVLNMTVALTCFAGTCHRVNTSSMNSANPHFS